MFFSSETYLEIADSGNLIRIEPICFSHPNSDSDWDRNWVKTNVVVKGGVFSGQFEANFMTFDFESFKQQLRQLDNDFNGIAAFMPTEEQLKINIKGDGLGHFEVDCEAIAELSVGTTLSFSMTFDQTQIKKYVKQLDKITKDYPIDGDFNIHNE